MKKMSQPYSSPGSTVYWTTYTNDGLRWHGQRGAPGRQHHLWFAKNPTGFRIRQINDFTTDVTRREAKAGLWPPGGLLTNHNPLQTRWLKDNSSKNRGARSGRDSAFTMDHGTSYQQPSVSGAEVP